MWFCVGWLLGPTLDCDFEVTPDSFITHLTESMKPTTPFRSNFGVFAATPCRGLSLSRFPLCRCASAIQIVCPLESIAETQSKPRALIATPSRELMKSRKDNNDIENEAGHSEHDQSLVTRFAPRQRPDEKDRPEECMKC
jgi:hypothetical protein